MRQNEIGGPVKRTIEDRKAPSGRNPFKGLSGAHYTQQLFFETCGGDKSNAIYTLKDYDHEVDGVIYPSIKRLYVDLEDESEYTFATTYFDSWKHYKRLLALPWFSEVIEEAREELQVKLAGKALAALRADALSGSRSSISSAKFLVDKFVKSDAKVGRPSKEAIKRAATEMLGEKGEFQDDITRLADIIPFTGGKS